MTNFEFSGWVNVLHGERMTTAMIHRPVHHSYLLLLHDQSYRIKNSLMRDNSQDNLGHAAE
jgi:DNA replication protein DnaC